MARVSLSFDFVERRRLAARADRIMRRSDALASLSVPEIAERIESLRRSIRIEGCAAEAVEDAFALIREVSWRALGKRHRRVQIMGGLSLLDGRLAEMATGEGKTLTALLPVVTVALADVPVHVVTVNDYLARRDAATLKPVFDQFGLTVGVVTHAESDDERRAAYACDIVYCVNKDLVFDYLRDGLDKARAGTGADAAPMRQNGLYFALIDEADSVLIDEARTPLVIAQERADVDGAARSARALDLASRLDAGRDYVRDETARVMRLTDEGRRRLKAWVVDGDGIRVTSRARDEQVEQALTAKLFFQRGDAYVVRDEKVQIVDEFTGRILPDRTWERGLHQMIEQIEGCALSLPRETIARQTYPRFFSRYLRIAGMSGTAAEVTGELGAEYGLRVVRIPPDRPSLRKNFGACAFKSDAARWVHVAERAAGLAAEGRPVLIGTRSVSASERIAAEIAKRTCDFVVLTALQDAHEAEVVARAGMRGRITIATNMAGRGTDIILDASAKDHGGLHVILTEFHESARVDRQLFGRAARQGDPGSCEACVSLDDELFTAFAAFETATLRRLFHGDRPLGSRVTSLLRMLAQTRAERRNAAIRRSTIHNDRRLGRALAFAGFVE